MADILKWALWYRAHGFSVFPVIPPRADAQGKDMKRPACKWEQFQKRIATEDEVTRWWTDHPDHRIGIATGAISNLLVVDCDSEEAHERVQNDLLPDTFLTPIAKSPHGWHFYFQHLEWIRNKVRIQGSGIDIRAEGGFIMAPPSNGLNGAGYKWVKDLEPWTVPVKSVPDVLLHFLKDSTTIIDTNIANSVPKQSGNALNFNQGTRDHTLFHIANCLVKGGMPKNEISQVLEILATKACDPPFPLEEIANKIKSALTRENTSEKTLTAEVREWVMSTDVHIMSTNVHKELGLSTRVHKKNVSTILKRLSEEGLIEKVPNKPGCWRKIDREFVEQTWWKDEGLPLSIRFPLEIHELVKVYPGNIILLEGQKSQGKSAFALEVCRMNKGLFPQKVLYQNVEMADSELLERFRSYGDVIHPDEWRQSVTFIRQTSEWWDKIQADGLNVIDYLVEYKEPWMLAQYVWQIHQKLKSGIALIVVQRDPFKPYPTGGRAVRDIPRVIISLIKHKVRLEDVKSFHQTSYGNPTGLVRKYKQVKWCTFLADSNWDQEEEEKYEKFKKF